MENIHFNFDNALVERGEIRKKTDVLKAYTEELKDIVSEGGYSKGDSFINLPDDGKSVQMIKEFAEKEKNVKHVIVVGIGGSNLGTKAIYEALAPEGAELLFSDTVSVRNNSDILSKVISEVRSPQSVLVVGITKSGTTTETVVNLEAIVGELDHAFGNIKDRMVIVTGEGSGDLQKEDIPSFSIPSHVGGRFSVFSAVGLLPLSLAGVDIDSLFDGAREMRDLCLSADTLENPAAVSAVIQVIQKEKGFRIHDTFLWNPEMESVGKWYSQLIAESLGKKEDLNGKVVEEGVTPLVSIGSTDLHSILQLFLGGPKDKMFTFIRAEEQAEVLSVPPEDKRTFPETLPYVSGLETGKVMSAIYEGVKKTFIKEKLPLMEIALDALDAYALGALLEMKMLEVAYMGRLLNVDTFDQPNVESYKEEVRKLLEK